MSEVATEMATTSHVHSAPEAEGEIPHAVVLTAKAVEMVKATQERENLQGYGLRVAVVGGGCSGFSYGLDLEKEPHVGDLVFDQDGVKVFVDPMSAQYLMGVHVDYVEGLQGSGFSFKNPNVKHTCGCGSSFSV